MRQALGRPVLLRCSLLRGSPQRIASAVWRFKGQLLPPPPVLPAAAAEGPDHAELRLDALTRDSSGNYECSVSNDVGSATCLFQVSGELRVRPTPACLPTPSWDQALSTTPTSTRVPGFSLVGDCSIPFFGLLQPRPFQMPHSRFGPFSLIQFELCASVPSAPPTIKIWVQSHLSHNSNLSSMVLGLRG